MVSTLQELHVLATGSFPKYKRFIQVSPGLSDFGGRSIKGLRTGRHLLDIYKYRPDP
jgi:hypothetical protein